MNEIKWIKISYVFACFRANNSLPTSWKMCRRKCFEMLFLFYSFSKVKVTMILNHFEQLGMRCEYLYFESPHKLRVETTQKMSSRQVITSIVIRTSLSVGHQHHIHSTNHVMYVKLCAAGKSSWYAFVEWKQLNYYFWFQQKVMVHM